MGHIRAGNMILPYGSYAQSGIHSLYADDYPACYRDASARLASFTVPNNAYLHFAHAYGFESFLHPWTLLLMAVFWNTAPMVGQPGWMPVH